MTQAQKGRVIYLRPERKQEYSQKQDEIEKFREQINAMSDLECLESVLRDQLHGAARVSIQNMAKILERNFCNKYEVATAPQIVRNLIHTRASLFYVRHCAELMMRIKREAFQEKC